MLKVTSRRFWWRGVGDREIEGAAFRLFFVSRRGEFKHLTKKKLRLWRRSNLERLQTRSVPKYRRMLRRIMLRNMRKSPSTLYRPRQLRICPITGGVIFPPSRKKTLRRPFSAEKPPVTFPKHVLRSKEEHQRINRVFENEKRQ